MGHLIRMQVDILKSPESALCFIRFMFCWIFAISYVHAENSTPSPDHPIPVISLSEGAVLYSSDSIFNENIIASIDRKKATVYFNSNGMCVRASAAARTHRISKYAVTGEKRSKKIPDKKIRKQRRIVQRRTLAGISPDKELNYSNSFGQTGVCIIQDGTGSKFHLKNETYVPEPARLFQERSNGHKFYHNNFPLAFFCKLKIPRGPPELSSPQLTSTIADCYS